MRKALLAGSDAVILDLEDSVTESVKDEARKNIRDLLDELERSTDRSEGPAIHVRINRTPDGYEHRDLDVAVRSSVEGIRLPKAEDPAHIRATSSDIAALEEARELPAGRTDLYPTVESARGVLRAEELARCDPRVSRLVLGRADLVADLGSRGDDELALLVPQALLALASRSAGIEAPVDGATTSLDDGAKLAAALDRARAFGFHGKSAIHPRQLEAINVAFTPTDEELESARRVIDAAEAASTGATRLDGSLIDAAIVRRARGVLRLRREQ